MADTRADIAARVSERGGEGVAVGSSVLFSLVILGPPRTKKNHSRIVGVRASRRSRFAKPRLLPSVEYVRWHRIALPQAKAGRTAAPITTPVNCRAFFYRDRRVGDAVGYYQALADLLQDAGILADDRLIVTWDGSRLLKDKDRPRVELELTLAAEDADSLDAAAL